jgi:predicted TIM-barrel fold metal-dependent hydrolase
MSFLERSIVDFESLNQARRFAQNSFGSEKEDWRDGLSMRHEGYMTMYCAIALEEHFANPAFAEQFEFFGPKELLSRPLDFRLAEMDAAGIEIQVLSHTPSAAQALPPDQAMYWSTRINDDLARAMNSSRRFAGFAALPMTAPEAAAMELERAVIDLGFRGAMIYGLTNGVFPDDDRYFPLYSTAERLEVPIYIHPADPHEAVRAAYYADYARRFPIFSTAAAGFTVETMTIAMRMMLSEIPAKFPKLKLILGHMGEALPFLLERVDESLSRNNGGVRFFRERFLNHFHVTTSGFFSDAALNCTLSELGDERVMFSVDWPYCDNGEARKWLDASPLNDRQRQLILRENASRVLRLLIVPQVATQS